MIQLKKLLKETSISMGQVHSNPYAHSFKTSEQIEEAPMAYSSPEAQQILNQDIKKMSGILGKASQQIIKIMMNGVKGGRYDAMDVVRGIDTGPLNRTHEGERPFMKMLWRKVRDGFRRYSKGGKLRR